VSKGGSIFALKVIDKGDLQNKNNFRAEMIKNEIDSMIRLHSPYIIQLHEVIDHPKAS
jgi:hypothetical protein